MKVVVLCAEQICSSVSNKHRSQTNWRDYMTSKIIPIPIDDPLELLRRCGGYYECPKDASGKRLGPLAGYAGKYETSNGNKLQFVGDVYVNFAKAERHGDVLWHFANNLWTDSLEVDDLTGFVGAPEGGKALAVTLATLTGGQYIFPEKKVTAVATINSREESEMVFDRHEPEPGTLWYLSEDVINNMSTPDKIDELMKQYQARLVGIICFLNRSVHDDFYTLKSGQKLPIISVVRKQFGQYRQDAPEVAADIAAGNVVWKPKNEWAKFESAMAKAK